MDYSILKQQILNDIKSDQEGIRNAEIIKTEIKNNNASYVDAGEYSKTLGDSVSKNIQKNIPEGGIPAEELGTFADECLAPVYRESQKTMLNLCNGIQKNYNQNAGIGLNPVNVKQDESRIEHIIERFDEAEDYEEVKFLTGENVARSITRGAVTDCIRENAKFHEDSGLKTRISRSDGSGCCNWCAGLVGTYDSIDKLPSDFWAIHRNCNCVIDYNVGKTNAKIKFKTQNSKTIKETEEIFGLFNKNKANNNVVNSTNSDKILFNKASTIEEAKKYAKDILGFSTIDYDKFNIDVANMVNEEITKLYNTFGNLNKASVLDGVRLYPKKVEWYAAYSPVFKEVYMKNVGSKNALASMEKSALVNYKAGFWSTGTAQHAINHEVGHAIQYYLVENNNSKYAEITKMREEIMANIGISVWDKKDTKEHMLAAGGYLSYYGLKSNGEFIAESIAEYQTGNARETATKVVEILLRK